jgi:DNA-binding GntR family transcriptional regulator
VASLTVPDLIEKYGATSRANSVYQKLHEAILSGRFAPGAQLNERILCEMFHASRMPVRHAIARLNSDGLVEQIPNVGAFVRSVGDEEALGLREARQALEAGAAALAAEKRNPDAIAQLLDMGRRTELCRESGADEELIDAEISFHRQLVRAAENTELERAHSVIQVVFMTLIRVDRRPGAVSHVEIAEAIASGDVNRAFQAVWLHLSVHAPITQAAGTVREFPGEEVARVREPERV